MERSGCFGEGDVNNGASKNRRDSIHRREIDGTGNCILFFYIFGKFLLHVVAFSIYFTLHKLLLLPL